MEKILKGLLRQPAPLYERLSRRASRAPSRQKAKVVGNLEKVLSAERLPQLVKQKKIVERVREKAGRSMIPIIEDQPQSQVKDDVESVKCEHTRSSSLESLPTLQSVRRVVVFTKFKKEAT